MSASIPARQDSFETAVEKTVKDIESEHDCRIAVSFRDPRNGLSFQYKADELFHAASTMKVTVMIEVFRQSEEGKFSMDDTIKADPMFRSMLDDSEYETGAANWLKERVNEEVPIITLVEQMMVVSDNLATNLLITLVRPQRVTATMRELGATDGFVLRCLQDIPAYEADISNRITANDLTTLLELIETDQAASQESCAEMRRILLAQEYRTSIPGKLPEDVRVGNKTGNITATAHDTAVVYAPDGTYYLTVLTDGLPDDVKGADLIADISRAIYDRRAQELH